ncbi:MAG: antitermination protein NusG [Flavobacteriaceae bacterium]|nr:antitermination protein NusG [Flavobacteriaceae bacterium]
MKKWFVIYTKPKQELKVVTELSKIGIFSYCPTVKMLKQYSDRKKKIEKPLMPSYVMVYIEECRRSTVFSIPGIVRYLFWLGKPAIIRESEIDIMKQHLEGVYTDISISSLIKGQLYEITEGPLAGKTGKIIEMKKNKVKLEITSLGMMVVLKPLAA